MNAIIELKDIKRDFLVGNETVHACLLYTSREKGGMYIFKL